jgi:hypothetical protein
MILNVGEYGDDYAIATALHVRPSAPGRRRWTATLPERFHPRTNRLVVDIITRKGTERTYHAAAEPAEE